MLRQKTILGMFARSPMRPLQQHISKASRCVELLTPFCFAVQKQDWREADKLYNEVSESERLADGLKIDIRTHLPKSLFLPVSRGDLLELLNKQENLANLAKDIAGIMLGRKMAIPEQLSDAFIAYLWRCTAAAKQADRAIHELDELLESGFRGKEVEITDDMINELNHIEHETDQMQVELRQSLFNIEKDLQPIDVVFLYQVINSVGSLADCAQQIGYQLQLLLAK